MTAKTDSLRQKVQSILNGQNLHEHQRTAAQKTFDALNGNVRAVITAAEMQAGKSGVALALCCLQRLSMNDDDICDRLKLKDTLYLVTMPDVALLEQAEKDLADAKNVVVSNFIRFDQDLERSFKGSPPKLILIDECHYGSNASAIRYCKVFDYLEKENKECKVVFISATPFGALYAAETEYDVAKYEEEIARSHNKEKEASEAAEAAEEAAKNSILRRDFNTKLVFHRTSNEYYGVREMLQSNKVTGLDNDSRNILLESSARDKLMTLLAQHEGAGWALVRVPPGAAMEAKNGFIQAGFSEQNIHILGKDLSGVPEDQLTTIERFKKEFDECIDFDEKLIAITVAGCRAGINFGQDMKQRLIATWDSTVTSVAAVVQANIGRACGYHNNRDAHHFTSLNAAQAYAAILDYLDQNTSEHAASDFDGLKEFFEDICQEFNVNGLDVGLTVKNKRRRPIGDVETYMTASYVAVPAKLFSPDYDFTQHTDDKLMLQAIALIREELLKDSGPSVKSSRAMRGSKKNWVKAQWVNGDTYDNKEKALKEGTMKERTLKFTCQLDAEEALEFNTVVMPGSGEYTEQKLITATIFSIFNMSRRNNVNKWVMTEADVHEMCEYFSVDYDDTMFVLFKRGEYNAEISRLKNAANQLPDYETTIYDESQFSEQQRNV
ncbi:DEAD/DEAH box helicase family protein [Serratia fonticola]|uniref:DEAD/DEAH box helicase family protein n=1 Tax=Serratia fonticola TaxID=47917 RepID=UPI0015C5F858|nr:DEAD/DEAH box helicase family protein [Serratia fonticola]NYA44688.1 DEAD/DEAH box helicase family protein [Serratia fonticola]